MSEINGKNGTTAEAVSKEIFKKMVNNDLEQNKRLSAFDKSSKNLPEERTKMRFFVCILGLLALTTSQMSRMVLNQSIPVMVHPSMIKPKNVSNDGSCPTFTEHVPIHKLPVAPKEEDIDDWSIASTTIASDFPTTTTTEWISTTENATTELIPIETETETTSTFLPETSTLNVEEEEEEEEVVEGERFMWNNDQRTTLLGGFYYGYFLFMIPGGRIAEAYSVKYVLLVSVAGSAIINLATPWMARNNFYLLISSRVILGIIQSGVFPGLYALINNWLTMSEASIFAPLIKMNLRLGMMLGSGLCGFMKYSWSSTFYSTGAICSIWSILWLFVATSNPDTNAWVSRSELAHINKKKAKKPTPVKQEGIELSDKSGNKKSAAMTKKEAEKDDKTPWIKILTSPSVIGLIIVKLSFNYALDFLIILLPSYLDYVHHASPSTTSFITTPMFASQVGLIVFIGWLAKYVIKERPYDLSKTAIRKIFQVVANGGMAFFLIILTFNDCNIFYVAIVLQIISLLSMFTAGGETMLPYDLSSKYPATIMAIANSVANLSGVTTAELSRYILGDQAGSYDRWNKLIYLVAGFNILGCIAFSLMVKAEPIDFESKRKQRKEEDEQFEEVDIGKSEKISGEEPMDLRRVVVEQTGVDAKKLATSKEVSQSTRVARKDS